MKLSRDFFDIGMHLWNGRYWVNLGGYASGFFESFRFKSAALAYFEANKGSYPWVSVEDWWHVDDDGHRLVICKQNNIDKFPAPPVLPNGERLPGYCYDARPDLVHVSQPTATTMRTNWHSYSTMANNWRSP